jgi:hypothetical protein
MLQLFCRYLFVAPHIVSSCVGSNVLLRQHFPNYMCSTQYASFLQFPNFMVSWYGAHVFSEWFWNGFSRSNYYWYHPCCYILNTLYFYGKVFIFQNFLCFFLNHIYVSIIIIIIINEVSGLNLSLQADWVSLFSSQFLPAQAGLQTIDLRTWHTKAGNSIITFLPLMVYVDEKTFPKNKQRSLPAVNKAVLKYTMHLVNCKCYSKFRRKIN